MRKILVSFLLAITVVSSFAQVKTPDPMYPARLVNDFAGLFSPSQIAMLEDSLVRFERATSNQIAVVTLNDLDGYSPAQMAAGLIDNWGIGDKDRDNGIVILLKPRNDTKGEIFIGVGSGLEGVLNDAKAGRVIDNVMLADLQKGDYFTATYKGARELMGIVRGEFEGKYDEGFSLENYAMIFVIILIVIIMAIGDKGKKGGSNGDENDKFGGGGGSSLPWWILLGGMGGRGGHRGGGGGFGGGGGGGGFGGFGGGGSFGGGGGRSF